MATAAVVALAASLLAVVAPPAGGQARTLVGAVESGGAPLADYEVTVYRTSPGAVPEVLASTETDGAGAFEVDLDMEATATRVVYAVARSGETTTPANIVTLAAVLGVDPAESVVVNPRTTVATAYAMAQFLEDGAIVGPAPGVPNASAMSRNVANPVDGSIGEVLDTPPNGDETSARAAFNSMANLVAGCVAEVADCEALLAAATPEGRARPADSLQALRNVVREPARNAGGLFGLSQAGPTPYGPSLDAAPVAWTLPLRFYGDGTSMNGPGNFSMDHEGTMWVSVNYAWAPPGEIACDSDLLVRFAPDGSYMPDSPYTGGGLSGAGYGITRDRFGDIWVSNFGFAALECVEQPPHTTLSQFTADGEAVSPPEGYQPAGVSWPQGIAFDANDTLWVANCGNDSVTWIPDGDTSRARSLTDLGVQKPFDVAFGADGNAYVTGTASDNVAVLRPDGTPAGEPLEGFLKPMGIAADSGGELWVANSGVVDLPCPDLDPATDAPYSVGHIDGAGNVTTFDGGGLDSPWGISVDGHDNVWVSNFAGTRLSGFCGRDDSPHCPEGVGKGDPLSPDDTGFFFDGLARSTATATDTAGNVWVTNNWKNEPVEINPGGYEVVVFLGLGGPVEVAPPDPRPEPPAPAPTPTTPDRRTLPAQAVVVQPRFTG
ncbi:MAG: hypothetical protein JJU45_19520 [Acidimicrobiia bacterium]|nr:hypothetical protein [Acidimicrobiia bacterium]